MAGGIPLNGERPSRPPAARATRSTGLRATAEIASKITSVAFFVVLARSFSTSAVGDWVLALAVVQLLWPIAGFGLDRVLVREIARDRSAVERLFYPTVWLKVIGNLVGLSVALVLLSGIDYSETVLLLVLVMGLSQCASAPMGSAFSVFQAHERLEYYFLVSVIKGTLSSLAGIAVILMGGGLVLVALVGAAFNVVGTVITVTILYRKFAAPKLALRARELPRIWVTSAPLGIQEVIGIIIFRIDAILLSLLTTAAVVGMYGAGYRVLEATLFLSWSVGAAVLPMYSYLARDGSPSLARVYEASLKFSLALMVPVGVVLLVCADPIVDLLFGLPKYEDTVPVLRWLALAAIVYPIGYLSGELIAVRRPGRFAVLSSACVAGFNIALNLVLIPLYDAVGAAVATLLSEALLAVVGMWLARAETGLPKLVWVLAAPLGAGAFMGAAMAPVAGNLIVALVVGTLAYLGAFALFEGRALRSDLNAILAAARRGGLADEPRLRA